MLFTWLHSRGEFMFLHCVAVNRAEVAAPWTEFRTRREQPVSGSASWSAWFQSWQSGRC